jgi:hypothetical protein
MSSTKEPDYFGRRQNRKKQQEERERAEREVQQRRDDRAALAALIKDIRRERRAQNESESKKLPIDYVAAVAASIAALVSAASLVAFISLSLKADHTAEEVSKAETSLATITAISQRPWINLEKPDPATVSGVQFAAKGMKGWAISWKMNIVAINSGGSPSLRARFFAEVYLPEVLAKNDKTVADVAKTICHGTLRSQFSLFPKDSNSLPGSFGLTASDIAIIAADDTGTRWLDPVIVGCITYDIPMSTDTGLTMFIYKLRFKDQHGNCSFVVPYRLGVSGLKQDFVCASGGITNAR